MTDVSLLRLRISIADSKETLDVVDNFGFDAISCYNSYNNYENTSLIHIQKCQ
jgi:hypothetical protein